MCKQHVTASEALHSPLTQLPSAISMLYKRDLIGYENTYKCTFKVTSRPILNLFILSRFTAHPFFIIFSYMPPFLCSHCCCQTPAPPLYWHLPTSHFPYTFPLSLPLHPPTSPPPTPSHFLSPYTLPLPLPSNSHVVVSVSSF